MSIRVGGFVLLAWFLTQVMPLGEAAAGQENSTAPQTPSVVRNEYLGRS